MGLLQAQTAIDLSRIEYSWMNSSAQLIVQNADGDYECVEAPEDGVLCVPGCVASKIPERDVRPCRIEEEVTMCCGSAAAGDTAADCDCETLSEDVNAAIVDGLAG